MPDISISQSGTLENGGLLYSRQQNGGVVHTNSIENLNDKSKE